MWGWLSRLLGSSPQPAAAVSEPETKTVTEPGEPNKYGVVVEMEHAGVLAQSETIQHAIRGKLKGKLYVSAMFAAAGGNANALGFYRTFALTDPTDFDAFAEAMKAIPGVTNIKKDDGPWERSPAEARAREEEQARIGKEKERRAKEDWERRKRELDELKQIEAQTKRADEEGYGPPVQTFRLVQFVELRRFFSSVSRFQVEALTQSSDVLAGGFMGYKRETGEFTSLDGALEFLGQAMNGKLAMPFQPKTPLEQIPFRVEYREGPKGKYAHLCIGGGRPTFIMAAYDLYIRESKAAA